MLAIDHLVYAAVDAASASLKYSATTGLTVYSGGKHEEWGTYNYLSFLGNHCYIEWLSIFDQEKAGKSDNPLIRYAADQLGKEEEGLIQIAFRTEKMDEFIDFYHQENIPFEGPFKGSRQRPDGSILAWQMLFPLQPDGVLPLPFLIQWENSSPYPKDDKLINRQNLSTVQWGTDDPEAATEVWTKVYKLPIPESENPFSRRLANSEVTLVHGNEISYFFE